MRLRNSRPNCADTVHNHPTGSDEPLGASVRSTCRRVCSGDEFNRASARIKAILRTWENNRWIGKTEEKVGTAKRDAVDLQAQGASILEMNSCIASAPPHLGPHLSDKVRNGGGGAPVNRPVWGWLEGCERSARTTSLGGVGGGAASITNGFSKITKPT